MRWPILIVVAQLAMASSAAAQVEAPVLGGRLRAVVGSGGQLGPLAPVLDGTVGAEGLGVSIRFVSDDIARWAPEVEKTGVVLHHRDGEPVCVGRVCGAYAPFDSVDALAAAPGVERVEAGWIALRRRPLFQTVGEVGGRHAHTRDGGGTLTGSGVTIGDIDEPIDVFHPAFLRADGGFFAWIDADGDGVFGTGDAVDRDRDGGADADERIRVLDSTRVWFDPVRRYEENRDGVFHPDLDWVYIDGNDNGHRDYGVGAGYFERDPGYGEPVAGLHLYTWSLIVFLVVLGFSGMRLMLFHAIRPQRGEGRGLAVGVLWLLGVVIAANTIAVFFEAGIHLYLPDNPTNYRLIHGP